MESFSDELSLLILHSFVLRTSASTHAVTGTEGFGLCRVEGWRSALTACYRLTARVITLPASALYCEETHVLVHVTDQLRRVGHRSINWRLMTFSGTRSVLVMGFTEIPFGSGFTSNSMRIWCEQRKQVLLQRDWNVKKHQVLIMCQVLGSDWNPWIK